MKKLAPAVLAALAAVLSACASTQDRAGSIGTSAADTATSATQGAVDQKVNDTTSGFMNKILGNK